MTEWKTIRYKTLWKIFIVIILIILWPLCLLACVYVINKTGACTLLQPTFHEYLQVFHTLQWPDWSQSVLPTPGDPSSHSECLSTDQHLRRWGGADREIILTLLGSWHFDKFPTSKRGKICTIHEEFIMWETNIDLWSNYRENSTIFEVGWKIKGWEKQNCSRIGSEQSISQ